MDSREIVRRAVHFERPTRIPMSLPAPYPHDFVGAGASASPGFEQKRWQEEGMEYWTDEWGCVWGRLGGISKGEVRRGAIEHWSDLGDYEMPDLDNPDRYRAARERYAEHPDKFRIGSIPGFPFNIARKLRRMDNYLMDVATEPEMVRRLNSLVADKLDGAIRLLAEAGADAIMFCEDWGTQDRLLVRPDVWREIFRPDFERLCAAAHDSGVDVFMHSCGYVYDIIEDLIQVGVNVLQFDQQAIHGIDRLSRNFGGRVTFWCPVDIQKALQTRDPVVIEAAAKELIQKLGCFGGGFIAGYYGDNKAIGLDPSVQEHACRAFVKYGTYAS